MAGSSQVPILKHSCTFVANVTNNVFLFWTFVDNYCVRSQQKNNIPVQLYLSNNGKCAIVCLSSQNGKLRKTSLLDLKELLTVNIDMFDSVEDWLDKLIRKASQLVVVEFQPL